MFPRLILVGMMLWIGLAFGADLQGLLPDPDKTPGVADQSLTREVLCAKKFTTRDVRSVTTAMKREVFQSYGINCLLNGSPTRPQKSATRQAAACPVAPPYGSVLGGEWVTPVTMRLPSLVREGPTASSDILAMGYRLKMVGVNASGVTAEMVKFQALWDRPPVHFIREHVRPLDSALVEDTPISAGLHDVFCPVPTPGIRVFGDIVPEGGLERLRLARHVVKGNSLNLCGLWEIDHVISLELGGSNVVENLWPQFYTGQWNARIKDRLENKLHALVCAGELDLATAQQEISTDWIASYKMRMKQ